MAHELGLMADGTYSMARAADTARSWHGLENVVPTDADYWTWLDRSGMNFKIKSAPVTFDSETKYEQVFPGKKILYRDDTLAGLSIVGEDYFIVQPDQVLSFFSDLCKKYNLKMDTAGVIRGGVKFWALAKTGERINVGSGKDAVDQYVLLASSADGSMATTAKHTTMRVVCSNTFHANINNGEAAIRVNHSKLFNADDVKIDLQKLALGFSAFGEAANALHKEKVTIPEARRWYAELLSGKEKMDTDEVNTYAGTSRIFRSLMQAYQEGAGNEATMWGLFNGVTYMVDHAKGRSIDSSLNSAMFGNGAGLKQQAWNKATEV